MMLDFIKKFGPWIAVFLLLIMFELAFLSMMGESAIVDEIAHIPAGYSYLKFGDYRINPEHPPLIKDLAGLPLQLMNLEFPLEYPKWENNINDQWETGWQFIYHVGNNADQVIFWSRILIIFLIFPLGYFLYKWTKELFGKYAALIAIFLLAFSPNIIAHSRYVATDFGVTVFLFIALYYFTKFLKNPSWKRLIGASIGMFLASVAKFSAFLLVPYFFLLTACVIFIYQGKLKFKFPLADKIKKEWLKRSYVYIASLIIIFILAHLLIAVFYYPHVINMPQDIQHELIEKSIPGIEHGAGTTKAILHKTTDMPFVRGFSQYLLGVAMVFQRVGGGNSAFLMGDYSNYGWWYYYITAFFLKTPVPLLILLTCGLVLTIRYYYLSFKRDKKNLHKSKTVSWIKNVFKFVWKRFDIFVMVTIILMFTLAGMQSKANIGLRWMLPIYPFLYIMIAGFIVRLFKNPYNRVLKTTVITIIFVWYSFGTIFAYPYYLSYFNEFIGSKANGYKYLVDSNLDWGQDLKRLAKWVDDKKLDKIYIDYFGGGVPEYYIGNKAIEWHSSEGLPNDGYLAVSATFYQMSEFFARRNNENSYVRMLKDKEPIEQIGNSILIYDLRE